MSSSRWMPVREQSANNMVYSSFQWSSGNFCNANAKPNLSMNYTMSRYSLWCNQLYKNMDLVFKKFNQNLNVKMASSLGFQTCHFSSRSQNWIPHSILELLKILLNNIYSPKQKLHFHLLNLYFKFYLSTKYKFYFIFVYKKYFLCLIE